MLFRSRKYVRRVAPKPAPKPESYSLTFNGIDDAAEYLTLVGYLERHAQVGRIVPVSAAPGSVVFMVELKEGLDGFKRAAARDGVVSATDDDGTAFDVR